MLGLPATHTASRAGALILSSACATKPHLDGAFIAGGRRFQVAGVEQTYRRRLFLPPVVDGQQLYLFALGPGRAIA